jgi:hypothetical protein
MLVNSIVPAEGCSEVPIRASEKLVPMALSSRNSSIYVSTRATANAATIPRPLMNNCHAGAVP